MLPFIRFLNSFKLDGIDKQSVKIRITQEAALSSPYALAGFPWSMECFCGVSLRVL